MECDLIVQINGLILLIFIWKIPGPHVLHILSYSFVDFIIQAEIPAQKSGMEVMG